MANRNKRFTRDDEDEIKKDFSKKGSGKNNRRKSNRRRPDAPASRSNQSMNDISWYAKNIQLLKDKAEFPYATSTGLRTRMTHAYRGQDLVVPGLMSACIKLSPLTTGNADDPVNVAADLIMGTIRIKNTGGKFYDSADVMIRLLAEGEFIAYLNWAVRLYATVNMFSAYNRYMPRELMIMQGCDPDKFREDLTLYRGQLNTIIDKASKTIYVPNTLDIYKRWAWLFANYYCDSRNPKDQLYFLQPAGFRYYEIDEETSAGKLVFERHDLDNLMGPEDIIYHLYQMLNPLYEDTDLAYITADLRKYYGDSSVAFTTIPEQLIAIPFDDPIVLQQFKNMRDTIGSEESGDDDIYQTSDGSKSLLFRGSDLEISNTDTFTYVEAGVSKTADAFFAAGDLLSLYQSDHVIDTPNPSPTAVDNMENTRLTNMVWDYSLDENRGVYTVHSTAGSEEVECFLLGTRHYRSARREYDFAVYKFHTGNYTYAADRFALATVDDGFSPVFAGINSYIMSEGEAEFVQRCLVMFDYAPNTYWSKWLITLDDDHEVFVDRATYFSMPQMRISNYACVSNNIVEGMNECALLSEFSVAGFGPKS